MSILGEHKMLQIVQDASDCPRCFRLSLSLLQPAVNNSWQPRSLCFEKMPGAPCHPYVSGPDFEVADIALTTMESAKEGRNVPWRFNHIELTALSGEKQFSMIVCS
jgi:hypothetical protein